MSGLAKVIVLLANSTLGPADCTLSNEAANVAERLRKTDVSAYEIKLAAGDVLRCSANGHEPRDLVLTAGTFKLQMTAAREVRTTAQKPPSTAAVSVEWRERLDDGTSELLASRTYLTLPSSLPVSAGGRILRFRAPDSSPVTVSVNAEQLTVEVPTMKSGGELVIFPRKDAFSPRELHVTNATTKQKLRIRPGLTSIPELTAGQVTVVPVYSGGIAGREKKFSIISGASVEAGSFPTEKTGGVVIEVSPKLCLSPALLELRRGGQKAPVYSSEIQTIDNCRVELGGLTGAFEVVAQDGERTVATRTLNVTAGRMAQVLLYGDDVRLKLRATFEDGNPASDLTFRVTPSNRSNDTKESVEVRTDATGAASVSLPRPGKYAVGLKSDYSSFLLQHVDAKDGDTTVELLLPATRLRITLSASGEKIPLAQLSVRGPQTIDAPGKSETNLVGLPFGKYEVFASAPGVQSERVSVELTKESPTASVKLQLKQDSASLLVLGEGRPVRARATAGPRVLSHGNDLRFRLSGVQVGERIEILADGYMPACAARTNLTESITVSLQRRGVHQARIVAGEDGSGVPFLRDLQTNCSHRATDYGVSRTRENGSWILTIPDLQAGSYRLALNGRDVTFSVPGPETTLPSKPVKNQQEATLTSQN